MSHTDSTVESVFSTQASPRWFELVVLIRLNLHLFPCVWRAFFGGPHGHCHCSLHSRLLWFARIRTLDLISWKSSPYHWHYEFTMHYVCTTKSLLSKDNLFVLTLTLIAVTTVHLSSKMDQNSSTWGVSSARQMWVTGVTFSGATAAATATFGTLLATRHPRLPKKRQTGVEVIGNRSRVRSLKNGQERTKCDRACNDCSIVFGLFVLAWCN